MILNVCQRRGTSNLDQTPPILALRVTSKIIRECHWTLPSPLVIREALLGRGDDLTNVLVNLIPSRPNLLRAVIVVESGFNSRAVSKRGAVGLMQLMPATATRFGVSNPYDPLQNVHAGARYLKFLIDRFGHDVRLALAAYNAGEEAVDRNGGQIPPFSETMAYVPRVLKIYQMLTDLPRKT